MDTKLTWNIFKRVFGRWHFWMFSILWGITGEVESFSSNNLFGLYLADTGRPIDVRNNYPMGVSAVGIVTTLIAAVYVDLTKNHWHIGIWCAFIGILTSTLILVYRPEPLVFVGYYLAGQVYCTQAVFFAWGKTPTPSYSLVISLILPWSQQTWSATRTEKSVLLFWHR